MPEFVPYPKTPRLFRDVVVTEKIDGTNGCIHIFRSNNLNPPEDYKAVVKIKVPDTEYDHFFVAAGSRNRWISVADDNYGFAKWVKDNAEELVKLGVGTHFGEWWGRGIQRNYARPDRIFSLFNAGRWTAENVPACVSVVPILYSGVFEPNTTHKCIAKLRNEGSIAAPGFMNPEGIIMYHTAAKAVFKVTLDNDDKAKGE